MDSARACIKASIASRGSSNCNWISLERETTRRCVPSGSHAVNGSRYGYAGSKSGSELVLSLDEESSSASMTGSSESTSSQG
eukprot:4669224-Pleurochrysis_carterae.AAC.3